jgi:hypothetical protein
MCPSNVLTPRNTPADGQSRVKREWPDHQHTCEELTCIVGYREWEERKREAEERAPDIAHENRCRWKVMGKKPQAATRHQQGQDR